MDVVGGDFTFKPYVLRHAVATEVAEKFQKIAAQLALAGAGKGGSKIGPATCIADARTNALLVMASPTMITQVDALILALDTASGDADKGPSVIPVPVSTDLQTLARTIDSTINGEADNTARSMGSQTAAHITVTFDDRSSTLIVAGPTAMCERAKSLVDQLIGTRPAGPSAMKIIKVSNVDAAERRQATGPVA